MKNLSDDTKAIVASNLTLAFFIREHMVYAGKDVDLRTDSQELVEGLFKDFLKSLDQ